MVTHTQEELERSTRQNSSGKWTQGTQLCLGIAPDPVMVSRKQTTYPAFVSQDLIFMYDFCNATWLQLNGQNILLKSNPGHIEQILLSCVYTHPRLSSEMVLPIKNSSSKIHHCLDHFKLWILKKNHLGTLFGTLAPPIKTYFIVLRCSK